MNEREPKGLTPREVECLKLTSIMSSKEIARQLGISAATVDVHIARAARKLEVSDRRRALRELMRREAGMEPPG
ncbi:MAG: helix-turn-helix transcriptional regulator, partial [Brevundimonas sp.]|nr:helix-turn-helix transcriptional regulator [Brevundimonas sp.]